MNLKDYLLCTSDASATDNGLRSGLSFPKKKVMTKEARQIGRQACLHRGCICVCPFSFLSSGERCGARWATVQFIGACWLKPETRGCSSQPDAILTLLFAHAGGCRGTGMPVFAKCRPLNLTREGAWSLQKGLDQLSDRHPSWPMSTFNLLSQVF